MTQLYLALVHHPIVNKRGELITTSVTNMDIHDIARSCRTFGFENYFIVTPLKPQQELISRILGHWNSDLANDYNPDRQSALSYIRVVDDLDQAIGQIEQRGNGRPLLAVTAAQMKQIDGGTQQLREMAQVDNRPLLLILGTGWGLHPQVLERADFRLKPIYGSAQDGYNHLSVRSAAALYCGALSEESLF